MAADHIEHVLQVIELVTLALKNIQALFPLSHEPKFEIKGGKGEEGRKEENRKGGKNRGKEGGGKSRGEGGTEGGKHLLKEQMKSVHQYSV